MKEKSNPTSNHALEVVFAEVALREQIERRAYHLWLAGGGGHGDHLSHWVQADSEVLKAIRQEHKKRATARKTTPTGKPRVAAVSNDALINR